jgi:hypothetical protein
VRVLPRGISFAHAERHQYDPVPPTLVKELRVVHLQRWELGRPYHWVVADVCALMRTPQLFDALLSVAATGVGRVAMDMFRDAHMAGRMGYWYAPPVTITAGEQSKGSHVTKRDLLSGLLLPVQQGRLKIAAGLPLGPTLERELTSFRMRLTAAGRDTSDVQHREGEATATSRSPSLSPPAGRTSTPPPSSSRPTRTA